MNTEKIIDAVGGRKEVMKMTGLTKGRISQWVTEGNIPTPWMLFFEAKFPQLDWPYLRGDAAPRGERRKVSRRASDPNKSG